MVCFRQQYFIWLFPKFLIHFYYFNVLYIEMFGFVSTSTRQCFELRPEIADSYVCFFFGAVLWFRILYQVRDLVLSSRETLLRDGCAGTNFPIYPFLCVECFTLLEKFTRLYSFSISFLFVFFFVFVFRFRDSCLGKCCTSTYTYMFCDDAVFLVLHNLLFYKYIFKWIFFLLKINIKTAQFNIIADIFLLAD